MKIKKFTIAECSDNEYFDMLVSIIYKPWFTELTSFVAARHKTERRSSDTVSSQIWYNVAKEERLPEKLCTKLDKLVADNPQPEHTRQLKDALHQISHRYGRDTLKPSLYRDSEYNIFVAVSYTDAVKAAELWYTSTSCEFTKQLCRINEYYTVNIVKHGNEVISQKAQVLAEEYYKDNRNGYLATINPDINQGI